MARATNKSAYKILPRFYDQLMALHRPLFEKARQRILWHLFAAPGDKARVHRPPLQKACDLCAGTGTTALELAGLGGQSKHGGQILSPWAAQSATQTGGRGASGKIQRPAKTRSAKAQPVRVYAVDGSPEMCRLARAKMRLAHAPVRVIQADMRSFRLPERVDLVTCEFDAINDLPQKKDLARVARAVARALKPGGYFCFDANTAKSHKEVWPMSWVTEGRGFFFATRGGYDTKRDKGWTAFEWFLPAGPTGKTWRRFTERYVQVAWTDAEIRSALSNAGLDVVGVWDQIRFAHDKPWLKPGCRFFYLAKKKM